ncbi:MAG: hypothetical protein JW888_14630 [Pirellulales bacterium]|nr:hypothetical protein [Pirellulales bacterium]
MKKTTRIGIALVVLCWSAVGLADGPDSAQRKTWSVAWQWDGDDVPPRLRVTLKNESKAPLELKNWALSGKDAGQFAFAEKQAPPATTLKPNESVDIRLTWTRKSPPQKNFDAAIRFEHNASNTKSPRTIGLREPAVRLPYKFRLDGFLKRQGKPVPRDSEKHIVLDDGYHDGPMIEKLLAAFADDYPRITQLEEIGTTWQGRKILALRITGNARRRNDKPAFLFVAAHHANELLSTEIVLDAIRQLTAGYPTDPEIRGWLDRYEIWCIPLANPDGLHNFFHVAAAGRKNGRDTNDNGRIDAHDGVDLNRNYPFRWHTLGEKGSSGDPNHGRYRGPSAASEPETKALMRLADRERFVGLITYHTSGSKILVPYTIDGARNPHPDAAWIVGAHMAALSDAARIDRDYMPVRALYSVDGVEKDWHYWRHGTLAFLWEGPKTNPPPAERDKMIAGARPGWQYLLRRLMTGPTLSGHVCDWRTGKPLEAVVSLDEIKTFENERHASHPTTGRFDRVLPIEGTYHLHVEREGYRPAVIKVYVGRQWKKVCVRLVPTD